MILLTFFQIKIPVFWHSNSAFFSLSEANIFKKNISPVTPGREQLPFTLRREALVSRIELCDPGA
jgi:hypothetical protein